jgi:hypothetical protein
LSGDPVHVDHTIFSALINRDSLKRQAITTSLEVSCLGWSFRAPCSSRTAIRPPPHEVEAFLPTHCTAGDSHCTHFAPRARSCRYQTQNPLLACNRLPPSPPSGQRNVAAPTAPLAVDQTPSFHRHRLNTLLPPIVSGDCASLPSHLNIDSCSLRSRASDLRMPRSLRDYTFGSTRKVQLCITHPSLSNSRSETADSNRCTVLNLDPLVWCNL